MGCVANRPRGASPCIAGREARRAKRCRERDALSTGAFSPGRERGCAVSREAAGAPVERWERETPGPRSACFSTCCGSPAPAATAAGRDRCTWPRRPSRTAGKYRVRAPGGLKAAFRGLRLRSLRAGLISVGHWATCADMEFRSDEVCAVRALPDPGRIAGGRMARIAAGEPAMIDRPAVAYLRLHGAGFGRWIISPARPTRRSADYEQRHQDRSRRSVTLPEGD